MKPEWKKYYIFLEDLRQSGVTNMYGAVPYLMAAFKDLDEDTAGKILSNWMSNYTEISKEYYEK